jgi:hypothetical protein
METESVVGDDDAAVGRRRERRVRDATVVSILVAVQVAWFAVLGYGLLVLIH